MTTSQENPTTDFLLVQDPDNHHDPTLKDDEILTDDGTAGEDPFYYFQDAIFLVENTFFKVPRHHFEQDSLFFRDKFSAEAEKGWTKDDPFLLDGLLKGDFVEFLKVICPKHFIQREKLSFEDWVSVLKLSTLWDFEEARQTAINSLPVTEADDPIRRIELATSYKVQQWFLPALQKLAVQEHRLAVEDAQRLGLDFTLKVAELRGKVQGYRRCRRTLNITSGATPVAAFIEELFPAAVISGAGADSRPWDPTTLSFLPTAVYPEPSENEMFGPRPAAFTWGFGYKGSPPPPDNVTGEDTVVPMTCSESLPVSTVRVSAGGGAGGKKKKIVRY